jgi:hypothetical protein
VIAKSKRTTVQISEVNPLTFHHSCDLESCSDEVDSIYHYMMKFCQWLATGLWFSPDTLDSSTYKPDRHDIAEIVLKVALNAITLTPFHHRGWHIVIIRRWSVYWLYYHFFGHPLKLNDKSIIKTAMLLFIYRYRKSLQIIFKRWRNICVEYIFTNKEFWSNMVYAAVCKYSLVNIWVTIANVGYPV